LIFRRITNETFAIGEGNVRWGGTVALIVGDDFYFAMLENTNALEDNDDERHRNKMLARTTYRVGCAEIDTNCFTLISHCFSF